MYDTNPYEPYEKLSIFCFPVTILLALPRISDFVFHIKVIVLYLWEIVKWII